MVTTIRSRLMAPIGVLAALLLVACAHAQIAAPALASLAPAYSSLASHESQQAYEHIRAREAQAPAAFGERRGFYDAWSAERVQRMRDLYPVNVRESEVAGVRVAIVTPGNGVSAENRRRVLINLHGGGFLWGEGAGGLVESIPIAATAQIEVVTVAYRQSPAGHYPQATHDVAAVYAQLLHDHTAGEIGIYGCSAGGILTAQVVAWLGHEGLPMPGAVGVFCAGLLDAGGDSTLSAPMLLGQGDGGGVSAGSLPYFSGVDLSNPLVFPGLSPSIVRTFPPTLLITGTRDFAMSSVIRSHALLVDAGVDAELHVWEGMWHSFFSDPDMLESREAYAVTSRFFLRHLAR